MHAEVEEVNVDGRIKPGFGSEGIRCEVVKLICMV
jgi:hypothetical protein